MRSNNQQPEVEAVVREAEALLGGLQIFRDDEIFFPTRERTTLLRAKSIKALLPTLKRALDPGEKVHFVSAKGFTFYQWEVFFGGVWANFVNATTLVLTDRRLLAFNVKHRSRMPKDIKNAIPLSEITSIRRSRGKLTISRFRGH
ncbi:MAG: hypothetical protein HY731_03770 [Candidatus Tectomicrobia bacterium]|nr:hypothetical protein [Candidatus Tectomicrobia bacterium]